MKRRPGSNRRGVRLPTSAPAAGGGGGGVVQSGLVFNLDASDPSSYPGTGLTWTDTIRGDAVTFSLAPGYRSDPGFLSFVGSNHASGTLTTSIPITQGAIEVWFRWKTTTGGSTGTLLTTGNNWYHLGKASASEAFEFFNDAPAGFDYLAMDYINPSTTLLKDGEWHQLVVVVDGNGNSGSPAGNNAIYLDGNVIASAGGGPSGLFFRHGSTASDTLWNAASIALGRLGAAPLTHVFDGDMAIVRMYDRPGGTFSAAEVAQNYAADSTKFQTFRPDSISSLTLWLDPDDSDTVTTSGGAVTVVKDKAFTIAQAGASSAAGPVLTSVGGRDWLDFAGGGKYMDILDAGAGNVTLGDLASQTDYEFHVVMRPSAAVGTNAHAYLNDHTFGGYNGYWGVSTEYAAPTNVIVTPHEWSGVAAGIVSTVTAGSNHVFGASQNSGTFTSYKDGLAAGTQGGVSGPTHVHFGMSMGGGYYARSAGTGKFYTGMIGEVLVFAGKLSLAERSDLYTYLQAKWGTP